MTRDELAERIRVNTNNGTFLSGIKPGCQNCTEFNTQSRSCKEYGSVPDDFILIGCDNWFYDDVPF